MLQQTSQASVHDCHTAAAALPQRRWQGAVSTHIHTEGSQRDLPVSAASPGAQRCAFKAGKIWALTTIRLQTPPPQSVTNISLRESRSGFLSTKRNKLQPKSLCCTTCWALLEALCLCKCRGTHLCATVQGVYSLC